MLAAQSIAGDDGALEVILGLGVMLTFTGVLLRALTGRVSRSRLGEAVTVRLDAAGRPSGAPVPPQPQAAGGLEDPVPALVELAAMPRSAQTAAMRSQPPCGPTRMGLSLIHI